MEQRDKNFAGEVLEVQEALSLQSLAMKYALPAASRIKDLGGMYRFSLYNSPGKETMIGSGERLTIMGICLGKTAIDSYTMRVSFLHMDLTEELRFSNTRELYRFDWTSRSNHCMGTLSVYSQFGEVTNAFVDEQGITQSEVTAHVSKVEYPMSIEQCDLLADRLIETIQRMAA